MRGLNITPVECPDIVIPDGETSSEWLDVHKSFGDCIDFTLYGSTGVPAAELEWSPKIDVDDAFVGQDNSAADIAAPAAGKCRTYTPQGMRFRLTATGGAVTGDQTWHMSKNTSL